MLICVACVVAAVVTGRVVTFIIRINREDAAYANGPIGTFYRENPQATCLGSAFKLVEHYEASSAAAVPIERPMPTPAPVPATRPTARRPRPLRYASTL